MSVARSQTINGRIETKTKRNRSGGISWERLRQRLNEMGCKMKTKKRTDQIEIAMKNSLPDVNAGWIMHTDVGTVINDLKKDELLAFANAIIESVGSPKPAINVSVQRMYRFESERPMKALADIVVGDSLLIKGIKVVNGKNGLFVSMPQEQSKDKKWYDSIRCLTTECRDEITKVVLAAYNDG